VNNPLKGFLIIGKEVDSVFEQTHAYDFKADSLKTK
jgi:hypothetical protein